MNDLPYQKIDAVGKILYVAPEDEEVDLVPDPVTGKHVDGKVGEVFVWAAHLRKKIPESDMAGLCCVTVLVCHISNPIMIVLVCHIKRLVV